MEQSRENLEFLKFLSILFCWHVKLVIILMETFCTFIFKKTSKKTFNTDILWINALANKSMNHYTLVGQVIVFAKVLQIANPVQPGCLELGLKGPSALVPGLYQPANINKPFFLAWSWNKCCFSKCPYNKLTPNELSFQHFDSSILPASHTEIVACLFWLLTKIFRRRRPAKG